MLEAVDSAGCGQQAALVGDYGVVTYEALQQRVNAVAAGLLGLGLTRGDLVLIKMSNAPEFAVGVSRRGEARRDSGAGQFSAYRSRVQARYWSKPGRN